jgi:alpha-beta hydrolase superfamily lysophospholipase
MKLFKSAVSRSAIVTVGGGHSIGGMVTVTQQARHGTYEAIMILGYSAVGPDRDYRDADLPATPIQSHVAAGYVTVDRCALRSMFHHGSVPAAVLRIDDELLVPAPLGLLDQARTPGIISTDAAEVNVPVLTCFGDGDAVVAAHAEPAMYPRSNDVALLVLTRSGHCHNFAEGRELLWNRMHAWIQSLDMHSKPTRYLNCNTEEPS